MYVHSAQPALCPHIEWAVAGVLGVPVNLTWTPQPAAPGTLRAQAEWVGRPGTAAAIASSLMGWQRIRFEITEDASPGVDGSRHAYTPSLGPFTAVIGANGDILVPENRLRTAMMLAAQGRVVLEEELDRLLGKPWDEELESFRYAGEGAPVRWLHAAG
ncbi:DUF3145 domain-containing protein [Thermobispora bispora]|uniref:DUF3145 domain-containing protein n=1 Tax=Thermobispora bispora TaxID=2006 RepID=UPI0009FD50F0|nr:DUF3145 domain-containing protein [Thermobispora bispora]MBO2474363.1 DUF3145 domain-containing protein [Actinomycetales bacterium]MBX6168022.1 DUF3145 domain-containing protein [Thermobispora bispora]MDI9579701.1 DUF3145 domain-containing protein [Thermobispora sp.]QSI49829.1 DUF3145 domain-containing protein [Thermobispora bispora]